METSIIEKYKGNVGISGAWLSELMGVENYNKSRQRGHIRSLRRGGNGRTALIDYQSMSMKMKKEVMDALGGNPMEMSSESLLKKIIHKREAQMLNGASYTYYSELRGKDGHFLKEEKVTEMWNSAKILDAIDELLTEKRMAGTMNKVRVSENREFQALAHEIDENLLDYPNNLPKSADRLRKKFHDYKDNGYSALVHGALGKESNHKGMAKDEKAVVIELISSGAKLNDVQVAKMAEMVGIKIDRRRVQEIRKENELMLKKERDGRNAYRNESLMQVDRVRPDMPLKMVSLDGWDVELYYKDENSNYNRLCLELVIDVMNNYPLGYAIAERESGELIKAAVQNAIHHVRDLFGDYYAFWQVQSDNFSKKKLIPYYEAVCKYFTPAAVGNAKTKPIERYFHYLESTYLWTLSNNSGHNVTAKAKSNDEWISAHKRYFPDKKGCIAQIEKMIEIERSQKIGEMREAWNKGDDKFKLHLDMCKYLMTYGEIGKGNMLTANGMKVIRGGVEFKFDCFDVEMRKHTDERWYLHYDMNDMNQALAVNEDNTLRFMMTAKKKIPMALADYDEQDWKNLKEYREFNVKMDDELMENRQHYRELSNEYLSKAQIEGDLSGKLLTDEHGQHKNRKYEERAKRLAAHADIEEAEVIESEEERKARIVKEAWSLV